MNCNVCNQTMKGSLATLKNPYRYTESGLEDVLLIGVKMYECPVCHETSSVISKIEELHALISIDLIATPGLLSGPQVRFLRKHAGFPAQEFAALIGVTPSHFSRFENEKLKNLGVPTDRLIRAFCYTAQTNEKGKMALQKLAALLAQSSKLKGTQKLKKLAPVFKLDRNHWKSTA